MQDKIMNENNTVVAIAGKTIDNDNIKNIKNMSFNEKIEAFNIKNVVLTIFLCLSFFWISSLNMVRSI